MTEIDPLQHVNTLGTRRDELSELVVQELRKSHRMNEQRNILMTQLASLRVLEGTTWEDLPGKCIIDRAAFSNGLAEITSNLQNQIELLRTLLTSLTTDIAAEN